MAPMPRPKTICCGRSLSVMCEAGPGAGAGARDVRLRRLLLLLDADDRLDVARDRLQRRTVPRPLDDGDRRVPEVALRVPLRGEPDAVVAHVVDRVRDLLAVGRVRLLERGGDHADRVGAGELVGAGRPVELLLPG